MPTTAEYYRRHLPHWQPKNAVFFVTFRLKFSLPGVVVALLREQHSSGAASMTEGKAFVKWDAFLDNQKSGPRWLARADVSAIVSGVMRDHDRQQYELYAYCIMPNHVHAVFEPLDQATPLSQIVRSVKGRTARAANVILCREGAFWQDESYDHVIRDNIEFARIVDYVLNNPVRAGLAAKWDDWPGTYCREELF